MVTKDVVILSRFLAELDGARLDSLETRIAFQKRVYLLQAAGIDLGYRFEWDVYGPYSRGLAANGARYDEERDRIDPISRNLELTTQAQEGVARVKAVMTKPAMASRLTDTAWLELLCSLDFISRALGIALDNTRQLATELTKRKPFFSQYRPQIRRAVHGLKQLAPS